jgi:DnaJ-class molecular chaperone
MVMTGMIGEYVLSRCGCCLGTGSWDDDRCPVCAGRGTVPTERETRKCLTCRGVGRLPKRDTGEFYVCAVCAGQGVLLPLGA